MYEVWALDSYVSGARGVCIGIGFNMEGAAAMVRCYRQASPMAYFDVRRTLSYAEVVAA